MMKSEFERRIIAESISDEDYALVEHVYNWHPAIMEKDQIAAIYNAGGMAVIRDMAKTANRGRELSTRLSALRAEMAKVQEELDALRQGK